MVELDKIAERITPPDTELKDLERVARKILSKISGCGFDAAWVGSSARNTFVRRERDIDIFVIFPPEVGDKEMQSRIFSMADDLFGGYEKRYAQHPYAHVLYEGFDVDLVPCHPYGSGKPTPVDRTPEHHRYVSSRLNDVIRREIRLLKQFLKGCGLYGAESSVHGFSGYLCELMILNYGSFEDTLREVTSWRYGITIGKSDKIGGMDDPLILVDPTDPGRNVAAALSKNSFALFIQSARRYIESPREDFFFPQKRAIPRLDELLEERETEIVAIRFRRPDLLDEILYPQIERLEGGLRRALEAGGFSILRSLIHLNGEVVVLVEHTCPRANIEKRCGPFVWDRNNSEKFWITHKDKHPYIEDGRWYVDLPAIRDAVVFIRRKLDTIAMGKNLKGIRKDMKIEFFDASKDVELLAKLLHPRYPWS